LSKAEYGSHFEGKADRLTFWNAVSIISGVLMYCAWEGGLPFEQGGLVCTKYIRASTEVDSVAEFTELLRKMHTEFAEKVRRSRLRVSDCSTVNLCASYIDDHITKKIDLHELAEFCGYSLNGLQHLFRKNMGMTPTDYIRKAKIARAKLLLLHTDYSCSSIGHRLSFCSQSYFITQFKQETGLTPALYRRKHVLAKE
jgi:AraC-like DNA-binding protein